MDAGYEFSVKNSTALMLKKRKDYLLEFIKLV